jgi:hypothetical protein
MLYEYDTYLFRLMLQAKLFCEFFYLLQSVEFTVY